MGFYIPAALLLASGLYGIFRLPRWHDPRYVRLPERRLWGFWHFLSDEEWTQEGLELRRRYFRYFYVAIALAVVGIVLGKLIESRWG